MTTEVDIRPVAVPSRIGQGTAVEQSRAVAQVLAAVRVAQDRPRDVAAAVQRMRDACSRPSLADRAFFRFPRDGQQVSGPSVHLAREVARCWGNIDHGVNELLRDDQARQSEMLAYAWDMETNTRSSSTFINPHVRDGKSGPKALTAMRDVYENNANAAARRLREAIFAVLPNWFVDEAADACRTTLANPPGDSKPHDVRVADALKVFADRWGVTPAQLEAKLGRPPRDWTAMDLAQLRVIAGSLDRGEATRDQEFPTAPVTGAEILAPRPAAPRQVAPQPGDPDYEAWAAAQDQQQYGQPS